MTRQPTSAVLSKEILIDVMPSLEAAMSEAVGVGKALGYTHAGGVTMEQAMTNTINVTLNTDIGDYKPSTLLDLESGKSLEVEVILGGVVERAAILEVEVPRLALMYSLMRVNQNQIMKKTKA